MLNKGKTGAKAERDLEEKKKVYLDAGTEAYKSLVDVDASLTYSMITVVSVSVVVNL